MAKLIFHFLKLSILIFVLLFKESEQVIDGFEPRFKPDYLALFLTHSEPKVACSGIILNQDTILTAAICLYNKETFEINNAEDMEIKIKKYDGSRFVKEVSYGVKEFYIHPLYDIHGTDENNIAILFLNKKIDQDVYHDYGDRNINACLDFRGKKYDHLGTYGFGSTEQITYNEETEVYPSGLISDEIPRAASLKEYEGENCPDGFICTIPDSDDENSVSGTCFGDEGSPLTTNLIGSKVLGMASSISSYAFDENYPNEVTGCIGGSFFTDLSRHENFINNIVGKSQYCAIRN